MFLSAATARIRAASLLCTDTMVKFTAKGPSRPDRVLIVRLDAIGDFVLWLNAAEALVAYYRARGRSAVLVANGAWADWARDLAIFEDVIAVDVREFQRNPLYRFHVGRQVRMLGCTSAVEPTYSRFWLLGDSVIRVSGAEERIGFAGDTSNSKLWQLRVSNRWYTRLVIADPTPCMELQRNAEFLRNLGQIDFQAKVPTIEVASAFRTDPLFESATAGQLYYVLFPGASWEGRRWPISKFSELAKKLYNMTGWHGVVCGAASDIELAADLCMQKDAPLLDWTGRTDLAQLAAVLSKAQLLLTNETSATHIAAACGVPTVCLLGGGHYGRFMPYSVQQPIDRPLPLAVVHAMPCFGCKWQCIYERRQGEPVPCVEQIDVGEVWRSICEMLGFAT